jgi:hypothetical protein
MGHAITVTLASLLICAAALPAFAADFLYRRNVDLVVGQSIVVKGVRSDDCTDKPPAWSGIKVKLPSAKLGSFSDGGAGTIKSNSCGKVVGARGIRFTAAAKGSETLTVLDDPVSVTVR